VAGQETDCSRLGRAEMPQQGHLESTVQAGQGPPAQALAVCSTGRAVMPLRYRTINPYVGNSLDSLAGASR